MIGLQGMKVAFLEERRQLEIAALVKGFGGEPYCVPAVREQQRTCAEGVLTLLKQLQLQTNPVIVFPMAVGITALFNEARKLGRQTELKEVLRQATTVCRGPNPLVALKREGLDASIRVRDPYTPRELVTALAELDLKHRLVVLLHYGERNLTLVESLLGHCWGLQELLLYNSALPEDTTPLYIMVRELIACRVAAIAFTAKVQAQNLLSVATNAGLQRQLFSAFRFHTLVAAVGPACARALESLGITPQVVPQQRRITAMIESLARYVSQQRGAA